MNKVREVTVFTIFENLILGIQKKIINKRREEKIREECKEMIFEKLLELKYLEIIYIKHVTI